VAVGWRRDRTGDPRRNDVTEQTFEESTTDITAQQKRELDEHGYTVMPGLLSEGECDLFADTIIDIWRRGDYSKHGESGVSFVPKLLQYSAIFEKCINHPLILAASRHMVGPDIIVNLINGRQVNPGTGHQPLHDFTRPAGPPFIKCSVIWCLDEFRPDNGPTRVVPGTHVDRERLLATLTDPTLPHPDERLVLAPRGSAIMHNSHLIHGGTQNRSGAPRRSLHNAFTVPSIESEYDWDAIPDEVKAALGADTKQLLGIG
jgi:ectoine hydroxylase-related dioxygenase (phytanoyl-CoA dioxygenase family)